MQRTRAAFIEHRVMLVFALASYSIGLGCSQEPGEPATKTPVVRTQKDAIMGNSPEDLAAIAQLTIDLSALQPYFHVRESKGRKPLVILKNEYMKDEPRLTKFGEPVQFIARPEVGERPYFAFTNIKIEGNTAFVDFHYPIEGIVGRAVLRKTDTAWKVEGQELKEK